MENENKKGVVCVTGEGKRDIGFLTNLPEASERLHIFHADLNNPKSFDEALKGCIGVFHVAHTMDITGIEPEEVVIKRCVEATLGILKACQDSKTVKRVVYTSSKATAVFSGKNVDAIDESFWSDVDYCRSIKLKGTIYVASEMETEKQALIFSEKNGQDLVTISPSMVTGPFLTPHVPGSVEWQLTLIKGTKFRNFVFNAIPFRVAPMEITFFDRSAGNKDQYGQVAISPMVHLVSGLGRFAEQPSLHTSSKLIVAF
ncbi:3-beta hydroxysteroid dehydrogenase/isomerase [Dillenia turbinata]|uniref:3-beta hydroxysteroid dehydrogenase/isomerase n=1 Tax=Dillenia turbinata TaxID=194707 RepID=A0AAN8UYC5_9MAGN